MLKCSYNNKNVNTAFIWCLFSTRSYNYIPTHLHFIPAAHSYKIHGECQKNNLQVNSRHPGESVLASTHGFFLYLYWKRTFSISDTGFLWARSSSCDRTNSVRALKLTHCTDLNQWPGLILSLSTTGCIVPFMTTF